MRKYVDNICIGLEHFIDKVGYQSSVYNKNGETIKYLINDVSGKSEVFINKYNADAYILPNNAILRLFSYVFILMNYRSKYVELYCTGRLTVFYALFAKIFFRKLVVILRGTEFDGKVQSLSLNLYTLKMANVIIVKEYNLLKSIQKYSLEYKTSFLHNAVPQSNSSLEYTEREIDILFLNTPRASRNVLFLIDVFAQILKEKPYLNIVIAGFSVLDRSDNHIEEDYQYEVLHKIEKIGLKNKIKTLGFVSNSHSLLSISKIFIFPADIIFCNYTLLEALSYGCVPIISNGEGAELIIDDEVDGRINNLDINDFVYSILDCLNCDIWNHYSINAKFKIKTGFSIETWYQNISKIKNKIV